MTNPSATMATASLLISTAVDVTTRIIVAARRHRRRRARQAAARAVQAFARAAARGGMTTQEVREMMAETGFLIGGER